MKRLMKNEDGISALEYILIALVVALAIVAGASLFGSSMNAKFNEAGTNINAANVPNIPDGQ